MKLKFKNANMLKLFGAVFCSCTTLFLFGVGFIGASITGDTEHNILVLKIFGGIFLTIWIIYFIVTFIFYKTIIVTEEKISLNRRKKVIWTLNKEDISECVYERMTGGNFISPNAATMLFRLKSTNKFAERKLNKYWGTPLCIGLSYKNVKKIEELGYKIRIIDSIYKQ